MNHSFKIAKFLGVKIYIHWTFFLLLGLFIGPPLLSGNVLVLCFSYLVFVGLFASVTAHEYGHILCARRFNVDCSQMYLTGLGGIAMIEDNKNDGVSKITNKETLLISLAGPLVSLFLFIILLPAFILDKSPNPAILSSLCIANLVIMIFNMLPIYPLDGGRAVRSLLLMKLKNQKEAIKFSLYVTIIFDFLLFIFGCVMLNIMMILISIFIFFIFRNEWKKIA